MDSSSAPQPPYIPIRFTKAEIAAKVTARRLPLFRRNPQPARLECVWLTLYLVPFNVTSSKGPGIMTVSVEGRSGAFAIFEMHGNIRHGPVEGEVISPGFTPEEAVPQGREQLLHAILRQHSRGSKPVVGEAGAVERLFYPFWVHYYERRRGRWDIRLIDAVTGLPAGTKIRTSVLEAFKAGATSGSAIREPKHDQGDT